MKEDMIRSYVRKRYGIVGDDWEVGEVQWEHSEELRNRGEGETHPLIPKILEKLIRTQGRIPPSITLFDPNERRVVLMQQSDLMEYEEQGFDWSSPIDVQTIDFDDRGRMIVTRMGRKSYTEIIEGEEEESDSSLN
jgi:hypothetical protein